MPYPPTEEDMREIQYRREYMHLFAVTQLLLTGKSEEYEFYLDAYYRYIKTLDNQEPWNEISSERKG